jgi:adenylosuccinate lyase
MKKVRQLDLLVAQKLGFDGVYPITTQTYPRVVDYSVLSALGGIAVAVKKMATDIRLLQGLGELSEPFGKSQVGSSAMAYKRNPMKDERKCGIARHVFTGPIEAGMYASEQWLERTLDDSAERRIAIGDTFLGMDADLNLVLDVFTGDTKKQNGFRIYPGVAYRRLMDWMPFIVSERLMMDAVKAGEDRQEVHEIVRQCSLKARETIDQGGDNPLLELMAEHPELGIDLSRRDEILDPRRYTEAVPHQVKDFIGSHVNPLLDRYSHVPEMSGRVKV